MSDRKFESCPFCGCDKTYLDQYYIPDGYRGEIPPSVVRCSGCHLRIPVIDNNEAVKKNGV